MCSVKGRGFTIKSVQKYLIGKIKPISEAFTLNIISALLTVYVPYITGNLFDELISKPNMDVIYRFCIYLAVLMVVMLGVGYIGARISAGVKTELSYEMNYDMLCHIQNSSLKLTSEIDPTYVNHRINCDVNTVISFTLEIITSSTINVIKLIVLLAFFIAVNLRLAAIILILDVFYLFFFLFLKEKLEKVKAVLKETGNRYYKSLQEQIANIKFIRALSLKEYYHGRLGKSYFRLKRGIFADINVNYGLKIGESALQTLAQIAIFVVGGVGLLNRSITIGTFTILINYLNMIIGGTNYCISVGNSFVDAKIAYRRLGEFGDIPEDGAGTMEVGHFDTMEFQGVSFGYTEPVINGFSYSFMKGSVYALCGANGAGKTTLLDIMAGLYPGQYEGAVYIDGFDLDDIDGTELRKVNISYCMQRAEIAGEDIMGNITLSRQDYDAKRLRWLAEGFGLWHLLSRFCGGTEILGDPDLGETELSEDMISGGEAQKISLIRGLLKPDCDMYIFDEPTNNLDKGSREFFINEITELSRSAMIVIATHDIEMMNACTEVIEIG
ncbi:MAG: ABC transporter ATP-binding protein [Acetatifactor sp.]|nr:ABC transporter ATP-binding protein [Acetatifactor sp.]